MLIFYQNRNETTATTITAPTIDGIIAIPANEGPQLPRSDCPTDEPIRPAKYLQSIPLNHLFSDCTCDETNKTSYNNGPQHSVSSFSILNQRVNFFD